MSRKVGKGAKGLIDPAFCCCAIPLVNAGIYSVIVEQGVVALAAGIMAISTPDVVGASFPDFALYILTAVCFIVAAVQPLGWIGVLREKTSTFRVYAWINATAVTAAFSVAAALIITSAVNHTKATAQCQLEFFTPTNGTSSGGVLGDAQTETLASQGEALCGPFAWADVGIMGGLWLILLLTQVYFLYLTKRYSTSQVSDHKLYHSVYSENPEAFTMSVLRSTRYNPNSVYSTGVPKGHQEDAWDARPSTESLREGQYQAQPGPSSYYDAGGRGDELGYQNNGAPSYEYDQYQQQQYQQQYAQRGEYDQHGHMDHGHPNQEQYGYDGQHSQYQNYPNAPSYVSHPENAMARDAGDTPTMPQYSDAHGSGWGGGDGGLRRPEGVQSHPAEGMFGRKSPRLN